jgi:hypothetical protein
LRDQPLVNIAFVALDPAGNVSFILQIIILFLLILGLPFFRGQINRKNFILHGYSTVFALVLHTVLIFLVMIPSFTNGLGELAGLSLFDSLTVWSHAVLGTVAEGLAIIMVVSWLSKGPLQLACSRWKKWMMPLFIVWVISIVNGALIHILGML